MITVDPIPTLHPGQPRTLGEAGISQDLVSQLLLKTLHFAGELSGTQLAQRLGLAWSVLEDTTDALRSERLCEVVGGSFLGGASFRYRLTDAGRSRALLYLQANGYVGTAPVPLEQYRRYLDGIAHIDASSLTPDRVRAAFSHLVLSEGFLDRVGPSITRNKSIFLYGEAGNGKTQIARALADALDGMVAIPHALEVDGQIIQVYDPVNHQAVTERVDDGLVPSPSLDTRWVLCRRPLVMVGGELTLEHLQLTRNLHGFYKAPPQVVACGGVLVVDDFGRQRCSPSELLNRWIVPLESHEDYLTLATGQTARVPFQLLVVFATNLKPQDLVDEAFLRRITAKVHVPGPTPQEFGQIFELQCAIRHIPFDPAHVDHLLDGFYARRRIPVRSCHPRDLLDHALRLADYRGLPRRITPDLLDAACEVYFVHDGTAS